VLLTDTLYLYVITLQYGKHETYESKRITKKERGGCAKCDIKHPGKFSVIYIKTCYSYLLSYLHLVLVVNINRKMLTLK
jgi:hypothetical protein